MKISNPHPSDTLASNYGCIMVHSVLTGIPRVLTTVENDEKLVNLLGTFFASVAFFLRSRLRQSETDEFHPEEFEEYLQGIKLDVKEDAEGYYATVRGDEFVEEHPEEEQTRQLRHLSNFIDPPDIFSVGRGEGKTVYVIQNLNIYITAEVVHQLNVNPK